jgi:hypothetical protein
MAADAYNPPTPSTHETNRSKFQSRMCKSEEQTFHSHAYEAQNLRGFRSNRVQPWKQCASQKLKTSGTCGKTKYRMSKITKRCDEWMSMFFIQKRGEASNRSEKTSFREAGSSPHHHTEN